MSLEGGVGGSGGVHHALEAQQWELGVDGPPGKAICQGESAAPLSAIVECGGRLMRAGRFLQGPGDAADGSGRRPGLLSVM